MRFMRGGAHTKPLAAISRTCAFRKVQDAAILARISKVEPLAATIPSPRNVVIHTFTDARLKCC